MHNCAIWSLWSLRTITHEQKTNWDREEKSPPPLHRNKHLGDQSFLFLRGTLQTSHKKSLEMKQTVTVTEKCCFTLWYQNKEPSATCTCVVSKARLKSCFVCSSPALLQSSILNIYPQYLFKFTSDFSDLCHWSLKDSVRPVSHFIVDSLFYCTILCIKSKLGHLTISFTVKC